MSYRKEFYPFNGPTGRTVGFHAHELSVMSPEPHHCCSQGVVLYCPTSASTGRFSLLLSHSTWIAAVFRAPLLRAHLGATSRLRSRAASSLCTLVNRWRWPILHFPGQHLAPARLSLKPGLAQPDPFLFSRIPPSEANLVIASFIQLTESYKQNILKFLR